MGVFKRTTQTKGVWLNCAWTVSDCDGMSRLTGHAEMPCTPKEILSRRIRLSAHEDKDSTQLLVRSPLVGPCIASVCVTISIEWKYYPPTAHVNVWQPLGTSQSLCPFLVMCVALFPERYSRVLSHIPNPVLKNVFYLTAHFSNNMRMLAWFNTVLSLSYIDSSWSLGSFEDTNYWNLIRKY